MINRYQDEKQLVIADLQHDVEAIAIQSKSGIIVCVKDDKLIYTYKPDFIILNKDTMKDVLIRVEWLKPDEKKSEMKTEMKTDIFSITRKGWLTDFF